MPQYPSRASSWGLGTDPADDWRELAACRDEDPELFFPVGSGRAANAQIKQAKAVCARCPVRARCLEAGMSEEYGVWGGLTEEERRALRQTPERPERRCEECGDIYRAALAYQRRCYACLGAARRRRIDPVIVHHAVAGDMTYEQLRHRHMPELVEAVRRMAAAHLDDAEIATRLDWPGGYEAVGKFRRGHGIESRSTNSHVITRREALHGMGVS